MIRTTLIPKKEKANVKETKKAKATGKGTGKSRKGVVGRPTKFTTIVKKQIIKLSQDGWTDEEISQLVGISYVTFYDWKKNKPEFAKAIKDGKEEWDNQIVQALRDRALGYSCPETKVFCNAMGEITTKEVVKYYPPDPTSIIFWLSNRQRENWKRNAETGTVTEPITLIQNFSGKKNGN